MTADQTFGQEPPVASIEAHGLRLAPGQSSQSASASGGDQPDCNKVTLLEEVESHVRNECPRPGRVLPLGGPRAFGLFAEALAEFDAGVLALNGAYWADRRAHGKARMAERLNHPENDGEFISPTTDEWERANQKRHCRYIRLWRELGERAGEISLVLQSDPHPEGLHEVFVAMATPGHPGVRDASGVASGPR